MFYNEIIFIYILMLYKTDKASDRIELINRRKNANSLKCLNPHNTDIILSVSLYLTFCSELLLLVKICTAILIYWY